MNKFLYLFFIFLLHQNLINATQKTFSDQNWHIFKGNNFCTAILYPKSRSSNETQDLSLHDSYFMINIFNTQEIEVAFVNKNYFSSNSEISVKLEGKKYSFFTYNGSSNQYAWLLNKLDDIEFIENLKKSKFMMTFYAFDTFPNYVVDYYDLSRFVNIYHKMKQYCHD